MKMACLCRLFLMHDTLYRSSYRFGRVFRSIGDRQGLSFLTQGAQGAGQAMKRSGHRLYQTRNEIITTSTGSTIQRVRKLLQKSKYRNEERLVVVENPKLIADVWKHRQSLIRQILVDASRWEKPPREWKFLKSIASDSTDIEVIQVAPGVLEKCTDTVTNQGMLAVCDMPIYEKTASPSSSSSSFTLILDGVSDPGNLGTLVRSAAATNVKEIILLPGSCDPWNPKAIRSAAATTFLTPIVSMNHDEWQDRMTTLLNDNVQIYAATMANGPNTTSSEHVAIDWSSSHHALILGNEGSGLSSQVNDDIDSSRVKAVHVPMMNDAVESLNVAICGSIILFERARQLNLSQKK